MMLAEENINEGEYGRAAVMVGDAICEMAYDLLAVYFGASSIGALVTTSATGSTIVSTANKDWLINMESLQQDIPTMNCI